MRAVAAMDTSIMPTAKERALSHQRLLDLLDYDPATGIFRRKTGPRKGKIAGGDNGLGYLRIRVDGPKFFASRLAWFYVHGEWPVEHVDHENRHRACNIFSNLRPANRSQNNANSSLQPRNKFGIKYVYQRPCGTYRVQIKKDGKIHCIGSFNSLRAAEVAARKAGEAMHGEFANV